MSEKQLNNTEFQKLDSSDDEIIWELERKRGFLIYLNVFWSYFVRFGIIGFCVFIIYLAFPRANGWITVLLFFICDIYHILIWKRLTTILKL